jgi:hypothetical protein
VGVTLDVVVPFRRSTNLICIAPSICWLCPRRRLPCPAPLRTHRRVFASPPTHLLFLLMLGLLRVSFFGTCGRLCVWVRSCPAPRPPPTQPFLQLSHCLVKARSAGTAEPPAHTHTFPSRLHHRRIHAALFLSSHRRTAPLPFFPHTEATSSPHLPCSPTQEDKACNKAALCLSKAAL